MRSALAIAACVAVLALLKFSIVAKERQLADGKVVYLELAPVDPRSLMQGDYMALRFKLANDARAALHRLPGNARRDSDFNADGRIVATLDAAAVATYRRLDDEVALRYRVRAGQMKFATNAYFFEEGTAERYANARYGVFRVAPNGDLLLTGMRGKDMQQPH